MSDAIKDLPKAVVKDNSPTRLICIVTILVSCAISGYAAFSANKALHSVEKLKKLGGDMKLSANLREDGEWRVIQPQKNGYELEYIYRAETECREFAAFLKKGRILAACEHVDDLAAQRGGKQSPNWSWQ